MKKKITLNDKSFNFRELANSQRDWLEKLEVKRQKFRSQFDTTQYERSDLKWYQTAFIEYFAFLYDTSIYDRQNNRYRVKELLEEGRKEFGGYDFVIIWHAYPRIGIDERNQFDFYRDMPGGLDGLRDFVDQAHTNSVRVLIVYKPWDTGTRRESKSDIEALAEIVGAIDADGIFLDTMHNANIQLREALDKVKPGIIFNPECTPSLTQGEVCTGSWGQDSVPPPKEVFTLKWIEPRFSMRCVDRISSKRTTLIALGFFHGMGHVVWENIFGWWNPFSAEDRDLIRRCNLLLHTYKNAFIDRNWQPYVDTLFPFINAHRWHDKEKTVYTLFNTRYHGHGGPIINALIKENMEVYDIWNGGKASRIPKVNGTFDIYSQLDQRGCGCLVVQPKDWPLPVSANIPLSSIDKLSNHRVEVEAHLPHPIMATEPVSASEKSRNMVLVPAGQFVMKVNDVPGAPEGGCYSYITRKGHPEKRLEMKSFLIDKTEVTNAEYKEFIDAAGYKPQVMKNFLQHWIKTDKDKINSWRIPQGKEKHPVVYVDLDDARAYSQWAKKRLPMEEEYQYAAQGADGRKWPWGNEYDPHFCNGPNGDIEDIANIQSIFGDTTPVNTYPDGASPFGCLDMSGNVWEWTESERDDGHTRYAIIRGGSYFRPGGSNWYVTGGAQPCDRHAKMLLLYPGLDRCSTIGFRCVKDLKNEC